MRRKAPRYISYLQPRPPIHVVEGYWRTDRGPGPAFPTSVPDVYSWFIYLATEFKGQTTEMTVPVFEHLRGDHQGLEAEVRNQLWYKVAGHVTFEPGWLRDDGSGWEI